MGNVVRSARLAALLLVLVTACSGRSSARPETQTTQAATTEGAPATTTAAPSTATITSTTITLAPTTTGPTTTTITSTTITAAPSTAAPASTVAGTVVAPTTTSPLAPAAAEYLTISETYLAGIRELTQRYASFVEWTKMPARCADEVVIEQQLTASLTQHPWPDAIAEKVNTLVTAIGEVVVRLERCAHLPGTFDAQKRVLDGVSERQLDQDLGASQLRIALDLPPAPRNL
jgi:hypothetical protein